MPKSINVALGDLNMAIGDFLGSIGDLFDEWSRRAYWRAGENFYDEAVELAIEFNEEIDTFGKEWDFSVAVDPAEKLALWVYGVPAVGTFQNGSFDDEILETPHGDEAPA
jgi:hypothetical protein